MALKDAYAARGTPIFNSVPWEGVAPLMAAAAVYTKAFVETLAKHHANALDDAVRTRIRKDGKTRELLVGPEDGSAAILVITSETPDQARLVLLDMDVTADEVCGKVLRWDDNAMAWRAETTLPIRRSATACPDTAAGLFVLPGTEGCGVTPTRDSAICPGKYR